MSGIFSNCLSLSSLPDLSKWKGNNNTDKRNIVLDCIILLNKFIIGE